MTTVSQGEIAATMLMTKELLAVATSLKDAKIGTASLIMAVSISGLAAGIPLEDFKATIEKSVDEVYGEAMKNQKASLN